MNKLILLFTAIVLTFLSCKKDAPVFNADEITYEVSTTSGSFSYIGYLDETGANTTLQSITTATWQITFKNKQNRPRILSVGAMTNLLTANPQPIITCKVYVNGSLVKTSSTATLGELQYNLN